MRESELINDSVTSARGRLLGMLMTLPTLTAGSTLFLVEAWVMRERKGCAWCRKKKIGPLREALRTPPDVAPDAVVTRSGCVSVDILYADTRDLLALHCKACGGCDCAKEPP